eukprot:NODE_8590_length_1483_cov_13.313422.p1 GENE.NODE_8590_length_1483_cov_13.313422~~NODE_8590_length_1483_cov_13.313422.p1  ORF type:complete len:348 (+),score=56.82 NODE_8590_length_1483_cov_13.313422:91-1134(+)
MGQTCNTVIADGPPLCQRSGVDLVECWTESEHCSALPRLPGFDCACDHSVCAAFERSRSCGPGSGSDALVVGEPRTGVGPLHHTTDKLMNHGGVYTGQVTEEGHPHGSGTQHWPDNSVYGGCWEHGAAHGYGELLKANGSVYEGGWLAGQKHGGGVERIVGVGLYRGDFAAGQRNGHGAMMWEDTTSYVGDFRDGVQHGEGVFVWANGQCYRGQWVRSCMDGRGRFMWGCGKTFEGGYLRGKKHGPGAFTWPDGSKLMGTWIDGLHDGIGTYVSVSGVARPRVGRTCAATRCTRGRAGCDAHAVTPNGICRYGRRLLSCAKKAAAGSAMRRFSPPAPVQARVRPAVG